VFLICLLSVVAAWC